MSSITRYLCYSSSYTFYAVRYTVLVHIVPLVYTGVHSLDCPSPPVHAVQLRLCVERVALRCVNGVQ